MQTQTIDPVRTGVSRLESTGSDSLASLIMDRASAHPRRIALVSPGSGWLGTNETLSYSELGARVEFFVAALAEAGVRPGSRVLVLAPESLDLCAVVVALSRTGLVAVFVDAGMPLWRIARSVARASVCAVIGVRRTLRCWPLVPGLYGVKRLALDGSRFGVAWLRAAPGSNVARRVIPDPKSGDLAVVSFTPGCAGRANGVERSHAELIAQHRLLERAFPTEQGEVVMSFFPLGVMHNLACGKTSVLAPPISDRLTYPDAAAIVATIRRRGVTTLCAPPRLIQGLIEHLNARPRCLRSVRHLVVGGAPVTAALARGVLAAFPGARAHVLYGATEADPITCASMDDVAVGESDGLFVGRPVRGVRVSLLDEARRFWDLSQRRGKRHNIRAGVVGEVLVSGRHVSARYFRDPVANACAKLVAGDGTLWHRTGDIARINADASLTLLGRTSDVILRPGGRLHPYPVEAAVQDIDGVAVAAFVRHRCAPWGELAVQLEGGPHPDMAGDVRSVLVSRGLDDVVVRRVPRIPTDQRHPGKVDRPRLCRLLVVGRPPLLA